MAIRNMPEQRVLIWLGNTKQVLLSFPAPARKIFGDELQLVQFGGMPRNAKPLKGLGTGVVELALRFQKEAYRCVVAIQLGNPIYMLHVFHKKSKKGSSTPKVDIALIKLRYQQAKLLEEDTHNVRKH